MSLPAGAARRPVTVLMGTLSVVVFGLLSLERLAIELLPDIRHPTLTVQTRYRDAAPVSVEQLVTRPVEEAVGVIPGVRDLRSVSRAGLSEVVLELEWGEDVELAAIDLREKLGLVELPREAEAPRVLRYDPSLEPVLRLALTGDRPLDELRRLAERVLKPRLEAVRGVAAAKVRGGAAPEVLVELDEERLAARGLSGEDVARALRAEDVNAPAGALRDQGSVYLVRTLHELSAPAQVARTVVRDDTARGGGRVRVEDVAAVRRGQKDPEEVARVAGREAVELALHREGSANTIAVARALRAEVERLRVDLPADLALEPLTDRARYVEAAIDEVWWAAVGGGLLAVLVLYFFLRDPSPTIIIALTIPISVAATFLPLRLAGVTINVMSLGGLALGVGMLVDCSIVVLEAIDRRRRQGLGRFEAACRGATEVAGAVTASTLTTIAVFLPIVFVRGVAGQLFRDLAVTVCASLLASLLASLTLIPALAALDPTRRRGGDRDPSLLRWDRGGDHRPPLRPWTLRLGPLVLPPVGDGAHPVSRALTILLAPPRLALALALGALVALLWAAAWTFHALAWPLARALDRVARAYPLALRAALRARWAVIGAAFAAFLGAVAVLPGLGTALVPDLAEGEFSFRLRLPEGTPLATTADVVARIEDALRRDPGLARVISVAGSLPSTASGRQTLGENLAQLDLVVARGEGGGAAAQAAAVERVRAVLARFPQVEAELSHLQALETRPPLEVLVHAEALDALEDGARAVAAALAGVDGVRDVATSVEPGAPEVVVELDRDRAVALGVTADGLGAALRRQVLGEVVAQLREDERRIDVRLRAAERYRDRPGSVEALRVLLPSGESVPVAALAQVEVGRGPAAIHRAQGGRVARVTAHAPARDLGGTIAAVREAVRRAPLPAGVVAELAGQDEELAASLRSLHRALLLAVFLVFVVMAMQFESVVHPFVILLTVPLGLTGVVAGLWATGSAVSVLALMGAVVLAGIVVNNGIVLVDAINRRRLEGEPLEQAITHAGVERLRPILMTTGTTVLGLLPMALGWGAGAELRRPLAIAVTGGLSVATLLTLLVIPCVYRVLAVGEADGPAPPPESPS
ncbi:MAG: efflux RND transporter permease subunit [Planctomycetes bacterium]|nr:efflux RND transporter permease subunit [Planctomycetota bacterium]